MSTDSDQELGLSPIGPGHTPPTLDFSTTIVQSNDTMASTVSNNLSMIGSPDSAVGASDRTIFNAVQHCKTGSRYVWKTPDGNLFCGECTGITKRGANFQVLAADDKSWEKVVISLPSGVLPVAFLIQATEHQPCRQTHKKRCMNDRGEMTEQTLLAKVTDLGKRICDLCKEAGNKTIEQNKVAVAAAAGELMIYKKEKHQNEETQMMLQGMMQQLRSLAEAANSTGAHQDVWMAHIAQTLRSMAEAQESRAATQQQLMEQNLSAVSNVTGMVAAGNEEVVKVQHSVAWLIEAMRNWCGNLPAAEMIQAMQQETHRILSMSLGDLSGLQAGDLRSALGVLEGKITDAIRQDGRGETQQMLQQLESNGRNMSHLLMQVISTVSAADDRRENSDMRFRELRRNARGLTVGLWNCWRFSMCMKGNGAKQLKSDGSSSRTRGIYRTFKLSRVNKLRPWKLVCGKGSGSKKHGWCQSRKNRVARVGSYSQQCRRYNRRNKVWRTYGRWCRPWGKLRANRLQARLRG